MKGEMYGSLGRKKCGWRVLCGLCGRDYEFYREQVAAGRGHCCPDCESALEEFRTKNRKNFKIAELAPKRTNANSPI